MNNFSLGSVAMQSRVAVLLELENAKVAQSLEENLVVHPVC